LRACLPIKIRINLTNKWFTIVNPHAGSGRGKADWPQIESLMRAKGIAFDHVFTEFKFHAVELAVSAVRQGYRKLLVVGGDGTLNEVVNAVFIQQEVQSTEIIIGVIAVGTGNDWFRMYQLPSTYEGKVEAIRNERLFLQDVGMVEYEDSKVKQTRYFANAAGIGFDAEVARRTNRLKENGRKGTVLYISSLIRALFDYRATHIDITVDGERLDGKIFSLTLGIGRYNGGGMMQVPHAVSDDGLFDITVIRHIRKFDVMRNIYRLYNGTILRHPKISGYKGNSVTIDSTPPVGLEVDGESLGTSPFSFSVIHRSINVVVGADFQTVTSPVSALCEIE